MAILNKNGENRIWVAGLHAANTTYTVTGFFDSLQSVDGEGFKVIQSAEQKSEAFLKINSGYKLLEGVNNMAEALKKADELNQKK